PALALELAALGGLAQRLLGRAGATILLGEEQREMAAENLVAAITLDVLRAAVPGRHPTFLVHHVDRAIAHALDQRAQLPLALPALPLDAFEPAFLCRELGGPPRDRFLGRMNIDTGADIAEETTILGMVRNAAIVDPAVCAVVSPQAILHAKR